MDDEPRAVLLLRNLLTPEGYQILTAHSGAEALAVALRELPDVVLLDVMMPDMDGLEVCTKLRCDARLAQVPILLLTALDDRDSLLKGIAAGADDFISKPYDHTELRARLRTITRLNRFRQLYEDSARLEAAVTHAPYGVVITELDGRILQQNAAYTRLLAANRPDTQNFYAHLPPDTAQSLRGEIERKPDGGAPFETPLACALNPATVVEISGTLVPWKGRRMVHFMIRDLTEKKQLEQQLLHSQRIELLGQLAGSAIHDVNNLLTVIGSSAQLLEMKQGADLQRHLGTIMNATQRGVSMLRQLLMFARGEDGALESVNPAGVTAEVAHMVAETFGKFYTVTYATAEYLPSVLVDPTQIHQIVMNLCVNARDAMPQGGLLTINVDRRTVAAGVRAVMGDLPVPGDYVAISVRDSGTGIPPAVLPKLFDPFFTTKPKGQGTGLGLATVIRLVRRHKGFVTLETEVGRGTCFACYFPVDPSGAV